MRAGAIDEALERGILVAEALQLLIKLRIQASVNAVFLRDFRELRLWMLWILWVQGREYVDGKKKSNMDREKNIRRPTKVKPDLQARGCHWERNQRGSEWRGFSPRDTGTVAQA